MDPGHVVEILTATLDHTHQEAAGKKLDEIHKIIGFTPLLLQLVGSDQIQMPVRQAGAVYLKNMVTRYWEMKERENLNDPIPFSIHEMDKVVIRENIVNGVITAPLPIRTQLSVAVAGIIKCDYPGKWPNIVDQIIRHLQSDNTATWLGALICLHQLIKHYEYKSNSDRGPLNAAMTHILPVILSRCKQLLPDNSEASVTIQKQILKCFYCLVQFCLPLDLISRDAFSRWMVTCREILAQPFPTALAQVDPDDLSETIWWKIKKWCLHIMVRTFERYGSPGSVVKEYNKFAEWYLRSFAAPTLELVLKLLETYRCQQYVAPRVLQQSLNYLNHVVDHASSWKVLKPHIQTVIVEVIFPLLCHSDDDQDLWTSDPIEYIKTKYDVFEEFLSPSMAAQGLLHNAASKRKQVLNNTVEFCMQVLTGQKGAVTPKQKDGILHILGALGKLLLKKDVYKNQVETLLTTYVYPEFKSEHPFLRARACWVLQHFVSTRFKDMGNLGTAVELTRQCLCEDKEFPVKVEAAIALQALIESHDAACQYIQPNIKPILLELLNLVRDTENDELTAVIQKLIVKYQDDVASIAVEMVNHLANIFKQVVESDDNSGDSDDKVVVAMGVLNTIDCLLSVLDESPEILAQIEPIVLQIIGFIISSQCIEYYEEILSHIYVLTSRTISDAMWHVFNSVYEMFNNDGYDYFTEMMPCLHNYVTVDPDKFASNPKHLEMIYNMCKVVLTTDSGEDAECHAAKLIEVLILQYKGQIDSAVSLFVSVALERLTREVKTSELRAMCLQVVIAALYYNPSMLFEMLNNLQISDQSVTEQFIKQWLHDCDTFLGLHDRRICILGLCCLMNTPHNRPAIVTQVAGEIIPAALLVFKGLKRAYQSKADMLKAVDDSDGEANDEDDDYVAEELEDDEDDVNEDADYLEKIANGDDDDDEDEYDEDDDDVEETALEGYVTVLESASCSIDEYNVFKSILSSLHTTDPTWYASLTGILNADQQKDVQEIIKMADQRKAVKESMKIEMLGGYQFQSVNVPNSFNFGGAPPQ
ncbi:importin-7-like [Watersipora subatra]|uniref:importin-7-like n=1 Tax=Watersipora subatra TaxID=2589382 RepID=UPI00355C8716